MPLAITPISSISAYQFPNNAASLSLDGRYLAYTTKNASGDNQIMIRDMHSGVVTPIVPPVGTTQQWDPVLSADGSKLAFRAMTGAATFQAYVLDLRTGQSQLASSDANGVAGTKEVDHNLSLSADGRFLLFSSGSGNLVAGDTNASSDVFRKDLLTGEIRVASSNAQGVIGNYGSGESHIGADGRTVIFSSVATNLLGARQYDLHLYAKDMVTGEVRFVDADAAGILKPRNFMGFNPLISADGGKVVFHHDDGSVYLKDLRTGSLVDIAVTASGDAVPGVLSVQAFSPDGRYVTFSAHDYAFDNVYQKDLQTGALINISPKVLLGGRGDETAVAASADGQTVVVTSQFLGFASIAFSHEILNRDLFVINLNGTQHNGANEAYVATGPNEQLDGGNGNDSYMVNDITTGILESAGAGTDTVKSYLANYTLPANVENLLLGDGNIKLQGASNPNGTGNELNNRITGNLQSNILRGLGGDDILDGGAGKVPDNAGNDMIDGGSGADIVVYQTAYASSTITKTADGYTVARIRPHSSVDLLQNIERIQFSDKALSLPGDTHAAQAYRIYQAAFNRAPDSSGLGFWVKQIDNGASVTEVAKGFMQSAEFKTMYGEHPANSDMVTKFYQNVLHRAPDAGGLAFWTDVLNTGRGTPDYVLAQFSESPENVAALTGVTSAGFTFTVFD